MNMSGIQIKKFYKGFSTRNYENFGGSFELFNIDVVNEDIINEIYTERGSRINMPTYGTRIPLLTFELNDKYTSDVIREDLETVIGNDPRVELVDLTIIPVKDKKALVAILKLNYLEFLVTKELRITVDSQ
jgi:phage baseplate assembly protein W